MSSHPTAALTIPSAAATLASFVSSEMPGNIIPQSKSTMSPGASLKYPAVAAYGVKFKFSAMTYDLVPGSKAMFSTAISDPHIFLPLPTGGSLSENIQIAYKNMEMSGIPAMVQAGEQAMNAMKSSGDETPAEKGAATGAQVTAVAGAMGIGARKLFSAASEQLGGVLDMKLGNIVNPYQINLFERVSQRIHTLTWRLTPKTKEDSATIRRIIRQFQWNSLPGKGEGGLYLTFPSQLEIEFYGTTNLYKFAKCVITGVTVNYAAHSVVAFYGDDKAPVTTELTINLSEVESLTRAAYEADGTGDEFGVSDSQTEANKIAESTGSVIG